MADNTKQFRWIVVIEQNLDWMYADDPSVFVAGDLFWYPVERRNTIVNAPDVMVVFGRPKSDLRFAAALRYRGSYKQWEEEGIAPQVVFEIRSPSNSQIEMDKKLLFYDRYGVEEYYIYNPDRNALSGWLRVEDGLDAIAQMNEWVSTRLGIRFDLSGEELQIYRPDGSKFYSYVEICQLLEQEKQRSQQAEQRVEEMEALLKQYRDRFGELPESEG
jgi:Uma2 family endonuclease